MIFNSLDFAVFLPLVFFIYWLFGKACLRRQNKIIVLASYVFYGWWNWKFLSLIIFSTLIDFSVGLKLSQSHHLAKRKFWLGVSIVVNLGLLGFFKYYNFFIENFAQVFSVLGSDIRLSSLNVILPVGISFYTFQTMSYSIDVYRKTMVPTHDFIAFSAYVSFFPQLVAGPIERAHHLLPQFFKKRTFEHARATDGMRQILWGLFKKMVIADNCAQYADLIFNQSHIYAGSTLLLGALFFTFQIYADFSGYSDIAIGTSRLFGFNLMQNFAFPYFSRNMGEFWRRWHISLSTWFRDYLYIPLGGSRGTFIQNIRNVCIIFILSGLWHGANWTFIAWGALNALYFFPLLLTGSHRKHLNTTVASGKYMPSLREAFEMLTTFSLTVLAWVFFRAQDVTHALNYINEMFSFSMFTLPEFEGRRGALVTLMLTGILMMVEWCGREQHYAVERLGLSWKRPLRLTLYYIIIIAVFYFAGNQQQFIYFQF